jgi:hypothetical protein
VHIVEESGLMNKSRINCFLYIDYRLTQEFLLRNNSQRPPNAHIERAQVLICVEMNQCRVLHSHYCCEFHWDTWMQDHLVSNTNVAEVYAALRESEAEAEEGLTEDDWEEGDSVLPRSSIEM